MGCRRNPICSTLHHFAVYFLIFLVLSSSQPRLFNPEGRPLTRTIGNSKIGSRPPRCDSKCNSCGHCEAIQVPTNPQLRNWHKVSTISDASGDGFSNYKPLSWKCKCGDLIFNP